MGKYFTRHLLYRVRNEIPVANLLVRLDWPHKQREGRFVFLCPACGEYLTVTNPRTNLGRCFACERNFNPIDLVMLIEKKPGSDTLTSALRRGSPPGEANGLDG